MSVEIRSVPSMLEDVIQHWKIYTDCANNLDVWLGDAERMLDGEENERERERERTRKREREREGERERKREREKERKRERDGRPD